MAKQTRFDKNKFELYRDQKSITSNMLLLSVVAIVFGMGFFYFGYNNEKEFYFLILGIIFIVLGSILLLSTIKQHKVVKNNEGFVHLMATKDGLSLAPSMGMKLKHYNWDDISKILLVREFISDEGINGKSYSSNIALIYLQNLDNLNLLDRSTYQIFETPKKSNVISLEIPEGNPSDIKQQLEHFSKTNINVELHKTVEYSYTKNDEIYVPFLKTK